MRIRTGDTVLVIAGKDKGKTGQVQRQHVKEDRVVVEGVNVVTRHMRPRPNVRQSGGYSRNLPFTFQISPLSATSATVP
jgi:large subunit ribosomal protein L24